MGDELKKMIEPRPCPFCGGEPLVQSYRDKDGFRRTSVECQSCFADIDKPGQPYTVVPAWNTRA